MLGLKVAILPGSFHPPTKAHLALARAALSQVERVYWAMPRAFPHKSYEGVGLEGRLRMVEAVIADEPRFEAVVTEGGLFIEMAREVKARFGVSEVYVLCGRDAAERIVGWDYGEAGAFERQLDEYRLLVAARQGSYEVPVHLRHGVSELAVEGDWDEVSSTEVRRRIESGGEWKALVPDSVAEVVSELYLESK